METVLQDLRYALRMLMKNPGFTVIAVVALALGIGANTSIFSFINSMLLQPLPYADSDRLIVAFESVPRFNAFHDDVSVGDYLEWKDRNRVFQEMAAVTGWSANLTGQDEPERIQGAHVSPNIFSLLGVQPSRG